MPRSNPKLIVVRQNGSSFILTIPRPIIDLLNLKNGQMMSVSVDTEENKIIYNKISEKEVKQLMKEQFINE